MKASDWITLLGAVVAAIAIVVSASIALIAVKIQRDQAEVTRQQAQLERQKAQKDADKNLAEAARALAQRVAQVLWLPTGAPEMASAWSEVMGLVVTCNELADETDATWYLFHNLAIAHGWLGEIDKANVNWKKALANADSGYSQVMVLAGEANFRYQVEVQIEAGRVCFDKAEQILKNDFPGDVGTDQMTWILGQRAVLEYVAGERGESVSFFVKAWEQCKAITSAWRRTRALRTVGTSFLQTFGQDQAAIPDTIPADLVACAADLRQQEAQQTAIAQQNITQQPPIMLQHGDSKAVNEQSAGLTPSATATTISPNLAATPSPSATSAEPAPSTANASGTPVRVKSNETQGSAGS